VAPGVELIGEYQGSGFQEPRYIVRRADGQVIQLSRLLYLLAVSLDGQRDLQQVAGVLSAEFGKVVSVEQVSYLIDNRMRQAGIVAADPVAGQADAAPKMKTRSDPLLAFKFRVGVMPERAVWRIAGMFAPMFWPPVILAMLAGFVGLDMVIIGRGGLGRIVPSALALVYQPALTLLVLALILVSAAFHECGHVTACRYGGAKPGVMGFGLYLVWPALYSTVTDSYRLGRIGRLRTDLGGVYFNAVFIAGLSLAYLETRAAWLLVAIVALHIETATQFLPMIRLDGYYILSDLIGVPDLFSRMGPALASIIPGRATHPRVLELKPWVRRTITVWVLIVVPSMLYWVVGFLIVVPRVLPVMWHRLVWLTQAVGTAAAAEQPAEATLGVVNIILLLVPWVGSLLMLGRMVRGPVRWLSACCSPAVNRLGGAADEDLGRGDVGDRLSMPRSREMRRARRTVDRSAWYSCASSRSRGNQEPAADLPETIRSASASVRPYAFVRRGGATQRRGPSWRLALQNGSVRVMGCRSGRCIWRRGSASSGRSIMRS
jgi:putative peptide zinc metalloprotease protein